MIINDLKFSCFSCHHDSPFNITAANRGEVQRMLPSGESIGEVTFICINCQTANIIEITLDQAKMILQRLSSNDSDVQEAIEKAKIGDYSKVLDAAKKLGFNPKDYF